MSIHLRFDEHDVDCEDDIVKLDILVCKLFAVWLCILVSVLLGNLLLTVLTHCVRRKLSLEYSVKSVWTVAEHSTHRGIVVLSLYCSCPWNPRMKVQSQNVVRSMFRSIVLKTRPNVCHYSQQTIAGETPRDETLRT